MKNNSSNTLPEIDKYLSENITVDSEKIIVATRTVVVNPNLLLEKEVYFNLKQRKLTDLICLAIGSWYLGDLGWVLREDLRKRSLYLNHEDRVLLQVLLNSKTQMLGFLLETTLWHTRDFFGNLLPHLLNLLKELKPLVPSRRKPRYPQRRRGYNDKGSRALDPFWKSARCYWKDTEDQLEKELKDRSAQDTLDFLLGFLE